MGPQMGTGRNLARCAVLALLAGACLADSADPQMPSGIFRGTMEALDGTASAGRISAKADNGQIYSCGYDSRTYVEINQWRVNMARLQAGDPLEIVTDRKLGSRTCYARTVHVVPPQPKLRPSVARAKLERAQERRAEALMLHADLTFSGVVTRHDDGVLVVKTRRGDESMRVRPDTRFLQQGLRQDPESLGVNTRVYVEAGVNLKGQLEAYRVVWGEILDVSGQ